MAAPYLDQDVQTGWAQFAVGENPVTVAPSEWAGNTSMTIREGTRKGLKGYATSYGLVYGLLHPGSIPEGGVYSQNRMYWDGTRAGGNCFFSAGNSRKYGLIYASATTLQLRNPSNATIATYTVPTMAKGDKLRVEWSLAGAVTSYLNGSAIGGPLTESPAVPPTTAVGAAGYINNYSASEFRENYDNQFGVMVLPNLASVFGNNNRLGRTLVT